MNPAKIVPISLALILAVALMGAQCTQEEIDHYSALLTGTQPSALVYPSSSEPVALVVEPSSSEEVVSVAAVVESEPSSEYVPEVVVPPPEPECLPVQWRGNWYSCDMMVLIGPVE